MKPEMVSAQELKQAAGKNNLCQLIIGNRNESKEN